MPFITDATWRPSTYRIAHRAWSLNTPETDGQIMPKPRQSKRKLPAGKENRFAPLRMFLNGAPASALKSNWNIVPDNENHADGTEEANEEHKPAADWKPEIYGGCEA